MFALQAGGQIMGHQAESAAVSGRNRAKLKNFEEQNKQYLRDVQLNNAQWKNDVQLQDIEQDQVYQAMIQQWSQQDQQLDKIFAQGDQKIEKAIVEMYENEYAGTGTGRTAARLAGKSAKKLGQYKSEVLHSMMMAKEDAALNKEIAQTEAQSKSRNAWEKIRFAPIHGHTPAAPELEAKPSKGALILGLATTALGAAKAGGAFKAPPTGLDAGALEAAAGKAFTPGGASWLPEAGFTGGMPSNITSSPNWFGGGGIDIASPNFGGFEGVPGIGPAFSGIDLDTSASMFTRTQ